MSFTLYEGLNKAIIRPLPDVRHTAANQDPYQSNVIGILTRNVKGFRSIYKCWWFGEELLGKKWLCFGFQLGICLFLWKCMGADDRSRTNDFSWDFIRQESLKDLNQDVLVTFIAEINIVFNSKPMVDISSIPNDPSVLSPHSSFT